MSDPQVTPPGTPPGEHDSELPDEDDGFDETAPLQEENAGTSTDQPSQ